MFLLSNIQKQERKGSTILCIWPSYYPKKKKKLTQKTHHHVSPFKIWIFNTKGSSYYAFLPTYAIKSMCWECSKSISSTLLTQVRISHKKK